MSFIERSQPPERDDAPVLAGQEAVDTHKLLPAAELEVARIQAALEDGAIAFADFRRARERDDWPALEAAALRLSAALAPDLAALSRHLLRAVSAARHRRHSTDTAATPRAADRAAPSAVPTSSRRQSGAASSSDRHQPQPQE